jgi:hypothetical protein
LTHIRNGDVQMLVVAVVIASVIVFGELVFRLPNPAFRDGDAPAAVAAAIKAAVGVAI